MGQHAGATHCNTLQHNDLEFEVEVLSSDWSPGLFRTVVMGLGRARLVEDSIFFGTVSLHLMFESKGGMGQGDMTAFLDAYIDGCQEARQPAKALEAYASLLKTTQHDQTSPPVFSTASPASLGRSLPLHVGKAGGGSCEVPVRDVSDMCLSGEDFLSGDAVEETTEARPLGRSKYRET
eukprot:CAMPEP_0179446056 /NCGR_PEP_ID=MMETSP0799-20121207/29485_1 /TAXON_ID=46947 /ORGANISM="Geminigera cryophila, Strain CCMP2564" /LENGTH=178 /DNA_ID=CAMNT_0021234683 /DNA_START=274 /DNA_END=807 /DNA_ORIENTATION=+